MTFCDSCGTKRKSSTSKFCSSCGCILDSVSAPLLGNASDLESSGPAILATPVAVAVLCSSHFAASAPAFVAPPPRTQLRPPSAAEELLDVLSPRRPPPDPPPETAAQKAKRTGLRQPDPDWPHVFIRPDATREVEEGWTRASTQPASDWTVSHDDVDELVRRIVLRRMEESRKWRNRVLWIKIWLCLVAIVVLGVLIWHNLNKINDEVSDEPYIPVDACSGATCYNSHGNQFSCTFHCEAANGVEYCCNNGCTNLIKDNCAPL